jgi:hypothetical protein
MSVNNNSGASTTTPAGGPGWVWGDGEAGWTHYDTSEGDTGTSVLAQTLLAGLQQQSEPPQDWFAHANSRAMAAMVAGSSSSSDSSASSGSAGTATINQDQFRQSGASLAWLQQSAGASLTTKAPAPTDYTLQASDLNASDVWANLTQNLYGTRDAAAVAQFKVATGLSTLAAGQRITPPLSLSYERTTVQSASLNASALTAPPGQWAQAASLESSSVAAYAPQVAFAPNGDGLSVWMQGADLMAATYSQASGTWSAPIAIDGNSADDPILPHLSSSANGNMLVTWKQGTSIYARRYVEGAWDSGPTALSTGLVGGAYYPTGAISDSGKATVVFAGSDGYRWNALANTFNGSSWQASPVQVDDAGGANDHGVNSSLLPRVAMDAAGNATMAWVQAAQGESSASLFVSRYVVGTSAATGTWSTPSSTVLETSAMDIKSFQLAFDAQGNGLAVWGQSTSLFAKSYSASTQQWGALQTITHTATGEFSLAVGGNGQEGSGQAQGQAQGPAHAIVSYTGTDNAIYSHRFAAGAVINSAPDLLSNASLGAARAAQASINAQGQAVVTFMQLDATGAERISTNRHHGGAWQGPEQIQSVGTAPQKPVAAIDARGNIQVLMSAQVDGITSLHAHRFEAPGPLTYTIPTGATWQSVAQTLYGSSTSDTVAALKQALSLPAHADLPAVGAALLNLPSNLSVSSTATEEATLDQTALLAAMPPAANAAPQAPTVGNTGTNTAPSGPVFGGGGVPSTANTASGGGLNTALSVMGYGIAPATSAATVRLSTAAPAQTVTQNAAEMTALQAAIAQSQQQVDAAATAAGHAFTARFSAASAANFAQESLRTWNQMRHHHLESYGTLDASTGWSESDYQSIVNSAAQTQDQASAANQVYEQALAVVQAAQSALNTLLEAQAAAVTPATTAQPSWGGGSGAIASQPLDLKQVLSHWATNSGIAATVNGPNLVSSGNITGSEPSTGSVTSAPAPGDQTSVASTFADDQVRISPPRVRSMGQWSGIKLVWEDRKDEPQVLMQFMRDYGVDAADIAYASGQSVQAVGQYLRTHGAAEGFAGWAAGRYVNPTYNASSSASGTPYATNTHGILISRIPASDTTPLVVPPNERSMGQWRDIRALWEDRLDEPAVLMQAMREYGIDAGDLAYATEQSVAAIGQYLRANGAADGFGNWSDAGGYYNPNTPRNLPEPSEYAASNNTANSLVQAVANAAARASTAILTTPPRQRSASQWADIAAVWQDRQDEPYRLMQLMVEYGFDVADIAYATRQSPQAVGDYMTRHGAPAGFGGAATLGQDAINAAYVQALNQAIQQPHNPRYAELLRYQSLPSNASDTLVRDEAHPWWVMVSHSEHDNNYQWSHFDVEAFTQWYASQNTELAQGFARLHQSAHVSFVTDHDSNTRMQVSLGSGAAVELSRPSLQGPDGNEIRVWSGSSVGYIGSAGTAINAYLGFQQADPVERNMMRLMVGSEVNQELLQRYGQPIELPNTAQGERMRARYGTELAAQLLRLNAAIEQVRGAYNAALEAAMHQGDHLKDLRTSTYAVQLTSMDTQVVDAQYPWWATTYHRDYDNNYQWSSFDTKVFHEWYVKQDTPESRLFVALHGSNIAVEARYQRDHDDDAKVWNEYYVGDGQSYGIALGHKNYVNDHIGEQWVPGGISASQRNGLAPISLSHPPELFDEGLVFFDPVMGFVTLPENIKPDEDWTDMIVPVLIGAAVGFVAGPALAAQFGFAGNVVATAGFGALAGSAASGLVANGKIDLKNVLTSALSAMLTAGFAQHFDLNSMGLGVDAAGNSIVTNWADRIQAIGVKAVFNGVISELAGGKFSQGLAQSIASSLAAEFVRGIHAEIGNNSQLSPADKASYRSLASAMGTVIRAIASPGSAMHNLAREFLNDLGVSLGEGINGSIQTNTGTGGGAGAGATGSTPTTTRPPVFDDEGYLMPGVVDPNASLQIQRQQVYNALLEQGLSPLAAQNLAQAWFDTGTVAAVTRPDLPNGGRPADPFVTAASNNPGLTDTSSDAEIFEAYLEENGFDGFDLNNVGWFDDLDLGRSYKFAQGFAQGTVFSGMATGEALWEIAKNPKQFIDGLSALVSSPQARAQLGDALLNQFNTDLQMFKDAYAAGDWLTAGQAAGKITTDFAQLAGGVQVIARLGVTATTSGGRLLLNAADEIAFARTVTLSGPQVRSAAVWNAAQRGAGEIPSWLPGTQVITEVVPSGTRYYMVVTAKDAALIKEGVPRFGMWATPDPVPSQAFARDTLAITSGFKDDVSYVIVVETTGPQIVSRGFAGPIQSAGASGTGSQVQFLEHGRLRVIGSPQPLPGN